jgi:putative membrane protein
VIPVIACRILVRQTAQSEIFKIMERRLLKAIIDPAMIVTWPVGLYLARAGHWF